MPFVAHSRSLLNSQIPTDSAHQAAGAPFSFSRRFLVTIALIPFVISLVISFSVSNIIYHNLKDKNGKALAELAFHMAETLDSAVYERFGDLMQISHRPDFGGLLDKPALLRSYFEQQQRLFQEYAWIGFVRPDGTVLAGSGGMLEGQNISSRDWVQAGMKAPFAGDVHEAKLLASLLPPPQDGEVLRLVDLALPVHDRKGQLLGVLGTHLSWQWAKDIRNKLLSHDLNSRQIEILVLNSKGTVLLGSSGSLANGADLSRLESFKQATEHRIGSTFERWPDSKQYNTGYARGKGHRDFTGLNWIVLARQPEQVAVAEAGHIKLQVLAAGGLLGILAGLCCYCALVWFLRPLERLAAFTEVLCEEPEVVAGGRKDEIGRFVTIIQGYLFALCMQKRKLAAENLQLQDEATKIVAAEQRYADLRRSLELRVLERTADLQDQLTALQKKHAEAPLTAGHVDEEQA